MLSPEESRGVLHRLFRQRKIVELSALFQALQTDSPMSVFRRLSDIGYLTSYNRNGRYYTLEDIPEFDAAGLWQYQGVFFSRYGTLKATTAHLVDASDDGRTHGELESALRVRVHNTLLDLVKNGRIGRERILDLFLYVCADAARADAQITQRHQRTAVVAQPTPLSGHPLEIAVLLEVIHGARRIPAPAQIVERLGEKGTQVNQDQVESVFHKHGLKKTPGSRSRSSRR